VTDALLGRTVRALDEMGASQDRRAFRVPGRIEVLGKHTDYAGGRSLLCAIERGIVVCVAPRADALVRIRNADDAVMSDVMSDFVSGFMSDSTTAVMSDVMTGYGWWKYAAAVVSRVGRDFPNAGRGADIAFASDLPIDSGLSSSSALVVAIFLALDAVNALADDVRYRAAIASRESLAEYLGAVENGRSFGPLEAAQGVGTLGGAEDHTAILCCTADTLSRYSFCPVRAEGTVPMPAGRVFVVAFSGVAAAKAGGALDRYNEASLSTREIVRLWNAATSGDDATLGDALGTSGPDAYEKMKNALGRSRPSGFSIQRLLDRLEQFDVESRGIIPGAFDALRSRDLRTFAELVDRSQANAERLLGNQTRETIALTRLARDLGADAASAFGAGFGGSVWAMVPADSAELFTGAWRDRYAREFPSAAQRAIFFTTKPYDGASEIAMENPHR